MKFVLVNDRAPFRKNLCAFCAVPIGNGGYLRDMRTRLCYCGVECCALQAAKAVMLSEDQAKAS
jgi:hypothetical protein